MERRHPTIQAFADHIQASASLKERFQTHMIATTCAGALYRARDRFTRLTADIAFVFWFERPKSQLHALTRIITD
jgi:hypothetical protein